MLRYVGFGASELAQNCFKLPGVDAFRPGWERLGEDLAAEVEPAEYAALQRATQYAHYTPEPIIRGLWSAAQRLGFTGGRVLEPGMGTGLFFALLPQALRGSTRLVGVEYDPVTARIARLVHPQARVRCEDYTRSTLRGGFDLVIGNPPFANRSVCTDPLLGSLGLRLHDWFIARSILRLRPGGIAIFVTSTGTMDKVDGTARRFVAEAADLLCAVRLPEGTMRATAGTDVVIDVLVFQRRAPDQQPEGPAWTELAEVEANGGSSPETDATLPNAQTFGSADVGDDSDETASPTARGSIRVNEYFATRPEMVLGTHALRRGVYGAGLSYTCRPVEGAGDVAGQLAAALATLPEGVFTPNPHPPTDDHEADDGDIRVGTAADGATVKEGSYAIGTGGRLVQIEDGVPVAVPIRDAKATRDGIPAKAAEIIRAMLPIRDALRAVLRAQAADRPWAEPQTKLRIAYSAFVRRHGPINRTVVTTTKDPVSGEERETHRRPNLACFADDPDCWLVASIEDYDLESGLARMGPVFRTRVIAPPASPVIISAADALAVTLAARGRVDVDYLASLLERDPDAAIADLGATVFRNPRTEAWETADAYLSGAVRTKLAVAEAAASLDPRYRRNVDALRAVQPKDLRPSDITARLGAPWIPTEIVEAFAAEMMGTRTRVLHCAELATWSVDKSGFVGTAVGTSEWGTSRRNAGELLHDALNSATPQIYDTVIDDGIKKQVFNAEATEAAKEKLTRIKDAFAIWVWTEPERTDRLARIYNDRFNNLVPRHFDGAHLTLPGASSVIRLYPHQKRVIWRIIASGSTYVAHAVGSGKTFPIAAAIMEQRRLGLVSKAMLVVPGHCLAQASREFLQLYPTARILVADETNFAKDKRARFLARASTSTWDSIVITHSAFRFIAVPAEFERRMIDDQLAMHEAVMTRVDAQDRTTRKRVEAMKERLAERLEALTARRDDMLTIEEIGVDQIVVDEAQEFRKLSFATNRTTLKGVVPEGSQRAWDLFVKSRFVAARNPGRALVQASGTPITNTLGEMYTLQRYHAEELLRERGVHEFDAWASTFGDTRTELELQPSGAYKPVERFSEFVNVPEMIDMVRSVADVVLKDDLGGYVKLPRIKGGQRQLVTAPASRAFKACQRHLAARIAKIEQRTGRPKPGDDILLAVITDGRHAAIDMRLVWPDNDDEPDNKLNKLVTKAFEIWTETADRSFTRPDGAPYALRGAGQLIFSDLGTAAAEAKRGFSAYLWIRRQLIRLGVPASQIALAQDFKKTPDKQRLFNDFNAGKFRFILGSTAKMGTGANVQQRLAALHHLDVPWLPSDIEQREGRIERQGNQNDEVEIYAYATLGSMDATMWQNNERKARFIAAALSGDRSIRRIEDVGSQASQFAMAKAIASGDTRLMRKAGLEAELARLQRQSSAHIDEQHDMRWRIHHERREQADAEQRIADARKDIARRVDTRGEAFAMIVEGRAIWDRRVAGASLLSKVRMTILECYERRWKIGEIGGFDLDCSVQRRSRHDSETRLILRRSGWDHDIPVSDDLTALGIIARLEHALGRFEDDQAEQVGRRDGAAARLAGYEPRVGVVFPYQTELDERLQAIAELEADLAKTEGAAARNDDKSGLVADAA